MLPRDDDFELASCQGVLFEQSLTTFDQPRVGILGDDGWIVVKAHPGRRHRIGVDVVEQVGDADVVHGEIQVTGELLSDRLRVFGEKQNPLARG